MHASIVRIQVKPGREDEFERVVKDLAAATAANETGAVFYRAFRDEAAGEYVFVECFRDAAALDEHRAAAHFLKARPMLADLWVGAPQVTRLAAL